MTTTLRVVALVATALATAVADSGCPMTSAFNGTAKINVHIVPHTHDDVGWNREYLEYYSQQVVFIIDAVIAGLLQNSSRKFSYVEQAFFQHWYEQQDAAMQATVKGLVANGQLTFINGGWSMHDEANPTFVDMLDNTHVGQRAIVDNFGVSALPNVTWQIDPFGHSAFQGVLSSTLSGYRGVFWGREMDDWKTSVACPQRGLERVWTPSASLGADATTFQAVFVDGGYGTPGFVGRCGGKAPGAWQCHNSSVPNAWGAFDLPAIVENLLYTRAPHIRYNGDEVDVMILFGSDFQWENALDFFSYTDSVILAINGEPSGRFHAFYSTPSQYLASKLSKPLSLYPFSGDFFPYNDDTPGHNLWTGYFTSRPAFKGFVRESSAVHQSARQLQALVGGVTDLGPTNPLWALERAMGVTQHHDSVAGTAKEYVNKNYSGILEGGRVAAFASMAASFATATGYSGAPFAFCPLANVTLCPALESGAPTVVLAYNALGQAAQGARVRVAAGFPAGVASYRVTDATGAAVTAQIVPLSARDIALRALYGGLAANVQWLCFTGNLPAAGFGAFFLVPSATLEGAPETHQSTLTTVAPGTGDSMLTNGRLTLTIAAATGFLSSYADAQTGVTLPLSQSWQSYIGATNVSFHNSSQPSGAYIFRPADGHPTATPIQAAPASVVLVTGPVINEAQHTYAYVTQATRLWAGAGSVEIEYTVGPVDVSDRNSHEVITRYQSGLATGGGWTTDSNCREYQKRVRDFRPQWNSTAWMNEPVSSNYYPVNCLIKTGSASTTLAVAVDRSEGGSSLADGDLELMVHRRLLWDDKRGVGEPLNEPGLDGNGLIIRGRHWLVAAPAASAPAAYKALHAVALSHPRAVTAFAGLGALTPAQWLAANKGSASLLRAPLPPNVHLTTVHAQGGGKLLLRLSHLYEVGEDAAGSADATVDLATLLAGKTITAAVDMTLPGTQPLSAVAPTTYTSDGAAPVTVPRLPPPPAGAALTITLKPQQIRTFLCTVM